MLNICHPSCSHQSCVLSRQDSSQASNNQSQLLRRRLRERLTNLSVRVQSHSHHQQCKSLHSLHLDYPLSSLLNNYSSIDSSQSTVSHYSTISRRSSISSDSTVSHYTVSSPYLLHPIVLGLAASKNLLLYD